MRTQPNIIVIIMDDLCPGDLSYYGNEHCKTPHIDRIAHEGVALERHCSGPLCSPARASLMTGRHHFRTRVLDTWLGRTSMDPDEIVLPEMFGPAGYATACFGKWHLGDTWPIRPEDRFDEALVHRGGGIGQYGDHKDNWERESYFDPYLYRNGEAEQHEGYCTDIFGDACCKFIKANKDKPFFAYLATNAPHTPLQVADALWKPHFEAGLPEKWARVYGMVENIDENVGKILDCLDECDIADDSLIMFFSDHGPCGGAADREHGDRPNLGLRERKGSVFEGGIRVPSFWRWPKGLPTGEQRFDPTHPSDVFCTLCAAAGVELPKDRPIDGIDLRQYLRGEEQLPKRNLYMQWHRGDVPEPGRNAAVIDGPWKMVRMNECEAAQLYNLAEDPREEHDIADQHGERVAQMAAAYDAWFADVAATRKDTFANAPIPVGDGIPCQVLTRNDWRVDGGDDWSNKGRGHWDLDVRSAGRYKAVLHFTPAPWQAAVRLYSDDQMLKQNWVLNQKSYEFEIELPTGPCCLRADAASLWGVQAVFHIELSPAR